VLGAVLGDIVGSKYEFCGIKTKDFPLLSTGCGFTDDTVMTVAVAAALLSEGPGDLSQRFIGEMRRLGRAYPDRGYGGRFQQWLSAPEPRAYHSFGNGSAMRVSPCGYAATTLAEAQALARASAAVTHDHPEGIKGAQAVAGCIWLARNGADKGAIREFVVGSFYPLEADLDQIRPDYVFDESCQGTVPQAIQAFLEGEDFEDALRNAVSLGGDSDTLACITGGLAEAFFGLPVSLARRAEEYLPPEFCQILQAGYDRWGRR
jgi:ADP-ribosylglycohydrolase